MIRFAGLDFRSPVCIYRKRHTNPVSISLAGVDFVRSPVCISHMIDTDPVSLFPAFVSPVCLSYRERTHPVMISPANHLSDRDELGPVCQRQTIYAISAPIYHASFLFEMRLQLRADGHPVQN